MGTWGLGMADSWGDGSSVRVASNTEDDGKEVVDDVRSSVEITSVTSAWRRPRKRACRLRPDARPPGERPYKRLATRCFARRSDPAQFAHRARNDAHPPQNTLTSAQPTHRPNRPSTRKPPSQGGAGRRGRSTAPSSTAGAFSDAHATKARVFRPEPSPTPTCAGYVVVALAADDAADRSSSTQFVRIPRNETRADTPLEILFGGHFQFARDWRAGLGFGPGIVRGDGAPLFRAVASIEWAPAYNDRGDRDGDGVPDGEDACPNTAGVRSTDPEKNGCPAADRDNDGVPDASDACPDKPGKRDPDPKKNGCPRVRIEEQQIKITEQIKFKTDSAEILPESDGVLTEIADTFKSHPEIKKTRVEGHTDATGEPAYNRELSRRRAEAVSNWLVQHGVERNRLQSVGVGQDRPIDTNATEEGRRNNRRVEFHIVDDRK